MFIKRGGGIINRKLLLSVLLLLGLALVLNANTAAAANATTKVAPKVTSVNPADHSIVLKSQTIKVKFNETIKTGPYSITLKNSAGKVIKTKNIISFNTLSIIPSNALATGVKYNLILNAGSVKNLAGNCNSKYTTSFTVSPITLSQMKDCLSRVQKFYNSNYRLPNYVTYGSKKIDITTFKKIIGTQGLKIKTTSANGVSASQGRPVYITSDNIISKSSDNARINKIIYGLKAMGIKAYNMGLGPNYHVSVLQSSRVPKNALVIDIYGGACAGTLKEMGSKWYKSIKSTREVFSVFWPPSTDITNLAYLPRAHDDNFDPASFKGIAHPDAYLKANGYNYIHSGSMTNVVNAIFYEATH
ncbi:Ig-like domain-containing protein [Methanobacterium sp. SMA-27]|uniref:Ig-like domain-containing protein n=1 Tax=Methanobacterium sp. SMA-27 TaxID=1495336 RepID=UPI00064ECC56|nr:Ig-like domain-containing protein [Methanobacterium sp. SMA-27]